MKTTIDNLTAVGPALLCSYFIKRFSLLLLIAFSSTYTYSQCEHDTLPPTVVCRDLHTTFMPGACMVRVWAKELVTSVSDDFSPAEKLKISFSPSNTERVIELFGKDGLEQTVPIYVMDWCGNQTVCYAKVIINDNDGNCVPDEFDLALEKSVSTVTPGPYTVGTDVVFDLKVTNEGTQDAYRIALRDYIPDGLILNDPNWTMSGDDAVYNDTIPFLASRQSTTVSVRFTIDEEFEGSKIINIAEIAFADNDTITTDTLPLDKDSTPSNQVDGEDDQDMAMIVIQKFDLAIKKSPIVNQIVLPGDTIRYEVTVYNQGTIDATGVVVKDIIADYMTNVSSNWSGDSLVIGQVGAGDSVVTFIDLRLNLGFQGTQAINNVEIVDWDQPLDDEDSDKAQECQPGVIGTGEIDDELSDDFNGGVDDPNDADECDHAVVTVGQVFDLALIKKVKEERTYSPGDTVTYVITVYNQGSLDATNVVISDLPPAELTIVDSRWTNATRSIPSVAAGDSVSVEIDLVMDIDFQGNSLINSAEIIDAENSMNLDDEDSSLDTIKCIAGTIASGEVDNDISDNFNGGIDNPADADECDYAVIDVGQRLDLALRKRIVDDRVYRPGDTVQFVIEVHNQGTVDATNIVVRDIPSSNMTIVDTSWTNDNKFIIDSLARGESTSFTIDVRINTSFQGDTVLINNAEIEGGDDDSDPQIDCVPDSTNGQVDDSLVDDVDECDYAVVRIEQIFDLALRKRVVSNGRIDAGDTVQYTIEVFNQGTIDAQSVVVKDYISQHMIDVDNQINTDSLISFGNIAVGQSVIRTISLRVDPGFTGSTIINNAEIVSATNAINIIDEDDDIAKIDCASDVRGQNEIDDEIEDNPDNVADVDDCDFATIIIGQSFDLAVTKRARGTSFLPGDTVTYDIWVYNQGQIDATDITLKDFVSEDMTNLDSSTIWPNDTAHIAALAAGDTAMLTIRLRINSDFQGDSIINNVEIIAASNEFGVADEDSNPAEDCVADEIGAGEVDDDVNDNPDNPTDADECDHAVVEVRQFFDLALRKVVRGSLTHRPGDTVTYEITVFNQGSVDATDIELTDYVPDSMVLVDSNWAADATIDIDELAAGASTTVTIQLAIDAGFGGRTLLNNVEITKASNELNLIDEDDDIAKIDCVPNVQGANEIDNEINDNPDNPADVDDCDFARIRVRRPGVCIPEITEWCGYSIVTCAGGAQNNEQVAAMLDMRRPKDATLGDDWIRPSSAGSDTLQMISPVSWVYDTIGQVFGTSLGRTDGNVYLAATNVYAYDGDPFTVAGVGPGGEQGIYRSNFSNPDKIESLVTTSNTYIANPVGGSVVPGKRLVISANNPLPIGWGNIAYDDITGMLYASNISDGRIYVIEDNNGTGIIRQVVDPFPGADGFLGFPLPANQVIWGLEINHCTNELYFVQQTVAGGGNFLGGDGPIRVKNIYSMDLNEDGSLDEASQKLELVVNRGTREKITDLDFNTNCNRMVMAERGRVHNSFTMLYELEDTTWQFVTNISVGAVTNSSDRSRGSNSTGGVSFGADMVGEGMDMTCDTVIWSMGDCLDAPLVPNSNANGNDCNAYGPTGVFLDESDLASLSGDIRDRSIFVGITSGIPIDPREFKFGLGDIEIFNCCCPDAEATTSQLSGTIAGSVRSADNTDIQNVDVEVVGTAAKKMQPTNDKGSYKFSSVLMHEDYTITPQKVDNPLRGVSTRDLLLIQNHVVGLEPIRDAHNAIAADVNNDGQINAKDMVALRRLLLGVVTSESTSAAWRFATTSGFDLEDPFSFQSSYTYTDLEQNMMNADFVAIKVGDVDRSLNMAAPRASHQLRAVVSDDDSRVDFYLTEHTSLTGLQLSFELPYGTVIKGITSSVLPISQANYNTEEHITYLSAHAADGRAWSYDATMPLFSVSIDAVDVLQADEVRLSHHLSAEMYTHDLVPHGIYQAYSESAVGYNISLEGSMPNPFSHTTDITFSVDKSQKVRFEFYTAAGALVHTVADKFSAGYNTLTISRSDLGGVTGTVFYKMITEQNILTKRMIIIE